uniref:Glutathione transferase n=1 Tax=Prymnesium polylepis TaxID=72548 RepID=A0A7S4M3K0_9EUKA
MVLQVYYWPMLARGAALVRMLEHTGTEYTYTSDKGEMAKLASAFGASVADTFAPPIVVDGDVMVSQSVASCLYVGEKVGLLPDSINKFKAMQYCADIVDTFEGNLGKHNEAADALKAFLEGSRFKSLMANLERGIKGPFYFGDEPSAVDFFLLQHMDWRSWTIFDPLKEAPYNVDVLKEYPKVVAIRDALRATDAYKKFDKMKPMGPIKEEILCAFKA